MDAALASGEENAVGELLRRAGLPSSHLTTWGARAHGFVRGRRMPAGHDPPANASAPRPFVTVAYVPSSAAVLEPEVMPRSCVHASQGDPACVLIVHHLRERKAGPQIPVTVVQCRTQRRAFTLYPLGHIPYGRLAVAPVGLDGQVLFSTERAQGRR